jgi:hypothetical protein
MTNRLALLGFVALAVISVAALVLYLLGWR